MKRFSSMLALRQSICMLVSLLLLSASCSKSDDYEYIDDTQQEKGKVTPRVTDASGKETLLTANSEMGVYVTNGDGDVTLLTLSVGTDGSIVLPPETEGESMIAYLPFQEEWGDNALTETKQFTVKEDQSTIDDFNQSDLIIGTMNGVTRAVGSMTFTHMMAQVLIHIVDATGTNDFENCSVMLHDVNSSVNVRLSEQSVSTVGDVRDDIKMLTSSVSDYRLSVKAIVAPQEIEAGTRFIVFTNGGYSTRCSIPQIADMKSGMTYIVNMRLTKKGLEFVGSKINDWTEEEEDELTIYS